MADVVMEVVRSAILLVIFIYLWIAGRRRVELSRKGWNVLLAGFALLLFGSLIDLTDNFPSLNRFVVLGETEFQAFLEKIVGYLGGFFLIAVGLLIWIPAVTSVESQQQLIDELAKQAEKLKTHEAQLAERAAELAGANVQIERERILLTTLVNSMPDAIYFKDIASRFTRANPGTCKMFGVDSEDALLGKTDSAFYHPDEASEYLADEQRIIATDTPLIGKEERQRWQDQSTHWVLTTKMPMHDDQGQVVGTFGVSRDITKQKLAEAALQEANEELHQSNVGLEQFAFAASHDLQEPLRAIVGFTQLLRQSIGDQLSPEDSGHLQHVIDGATTMKTLIQDLLEYSRLHTGSVKIVAANMNQIVEEAKLRLSASIESSGAAIHCDDLPTIGADETQMVQLFQNLLGNAIKYRRDSPTDIWVSAVQGDGDWTFSVRDTGIGIAPKYQEKIFLLFQRLHARSEYEGTGLGLPICQQIVQSHGGRIWVESEVGEGSVFYFNIPQLPDSDDATGGASG